MIDWKEILPIDALAPLLGGFLVWFGLNYLFIGPSVIAPRLAEKYYMPVCVASVEQGKNEIAKRLKEAENSFLAKVAKHADDIRRENSNPLGNFLGEMYGQDGQRFVQRHGDKLKAMTSPAVERELNRQIREVTADFNTKQQAEIEKMRDKQKYNDAAGFCGCNIKAGLSDRFEVALFSASLRLYKPTGISDLEEGRNFEQCGSIPVLS